MTKLKNSIFKSFSLLFLIVGLSFNSIIVQAEDPTTLAVEQEDKGLFSSISSFGQRLGMGRATSNDPLRPEQAFILSTEVIDGHNISVRWDIAEGYYLYRDKVSFSLVDADGISIAPHELNRGKKKHDESFGEMEVFFHELEVAIPLQRNNQAAQQITLLIKYQGCAEIGFCYPPMKQEVKFSLPAVDTPTPKTVTEAATPSNDTYESDQDRYARNLAEDNIALSMLSFFGLGLLLTFTPCVFPMIPILSSIIAGQGSQITTRRAFTLSLIYVLAMALTYTFAGLMAGLFGSNLQAAFQDPWILGSFSVVFVLLAISMFGFYELQMPQAIQNRITALSNKQKGGSYIGVGIMGFLSALIVGPCIAAPLAGALIYIGQTGDAMLGALTLFSLSMGMGAPLLLIGTSAGKLMPKAGPWMNTIKAVFGVLLLGVAIWLLERIIPASISLAMWAVLLIVSAVYLGAFERLQPEAGGWHKLWKGLGVVILIYGAMLLVGALSGGKDVFQPLGNMSSAANGSENNQNSHLKFKQIKGLAGLEAALKQASAQNKTVMLDFYADWCISCVEMEKKTFSDPAVQAALKNTVLLQADVTPNDEQDKALLEAFGLFGPPSILFFDSRGEELAQYRLMGFMGAKQFETHTRAALNLY